MQTYVITHTTKYKYVFISTIYHILNFTNTYLKIGKLQEKQSKKFQLIFDNTFNYRIKLTKILIPSTKPYRKTMQTNNATALTT